MNNVHIALLQESTCNLIHVAAMPKDIVKPKPVNNK